MSNKKALKYGNTSEQNKTSTTKNNVKQLLAVYGIYK